MWRGQKPKLFEMAFAWLSELVAQHLYRVRLFGGGRGGEGA
jgi:hypothetical protein